MLLLIVLLLVLAMGAEVDTPPSRFSLPRTRYRLCSCPGEEIIFSP